jgi:hypothetical protein
VALFHNALRPELKAVIPTTASCPISNAITILSRVGGAAMLTYARVVGRNLRGDEIKTAISDGFRLSPARPASR